MNYLRTAALSVLALVIFTGAADAQKKTGKKTTAKKTAAASSTIPPLDVRAAREKVSNQLENVNRFVDVLGPVAQNIEELNELAKTKPLKPKIAALNDEHKQNVLLTIRNLRTGLGDLESDFRTKPDLQKYLASIQGISDLAAQSEDLAIAGKFVASKEPLRTLAQKLADTLKVLPASPGI